MTRLGTCVHAHQLQLVEYVPLEASPGAQSYTEACPESYTCQWLDYIEDCAEEALPPAIQRQNGNFVIEAGDCEHCPHFQPAGGNQLAESMERYKLLRSQKKLAKKPRRRPAKPARAVK
jgi:hypothetical protein